MSQAKFNEALDAAAASVFANAAERAEIAEALTATYHEGASLAAWIWDALHKCRWRGYGH
jgi:hypothetical protein